MTTLTGSSRLWHPLQDVFTSKAVIQASGVVDQAGETINMLRDTIGKSALTADVISAAANQQAAGLAPSSGRPA